MASERITLESFGSNINPVQAARLEELRKAGAQGRPDGVIQNPGSPVNWQDIEGLGIIPTDSGGVGSTIPAFTFDWEAARKAAFDPDNPSASPLGKYYLQKLQEAKDDVELAKKYIEADYQRGVRYRAEDLETQLAQEKLTAGEETRETRGELNRRGVLLAEIPQGEQTVKAPTSGYAEAFFLNPLAERQRLRKQAIERAITRQGEIAKTEQYERPLEEQNIQYPRTQRALQEETREKAYLTYVPQKYAEEKAKFYAAKGIGGI